MGLNIQAPHLLAKIADQVPAETGVNDWMPAFSGMTTLRRDLSPSPIPALE